jgi:hypothetical protein
VYVKLYSSILDSSVWAEGLETRIVWIAMLAMADRDGFVRASPSGLARRANVGPEACAAACATLEAPDPESCNPDHEGRRVEHLEAGWQILNYGLYRTLHDPEVRREQVRQAAHTYREKKKAERHQGRNQASSDVISGKPESAQAEAEAEAKAKAKAEANKKQQQQIPDASHRGFRETWLTPYIETWTAYYGGNPSAGELANFLGPLRSAHGDPAVKKAWENYLSHTEAQYANPARFAKTYGSWTGNAPKPKPTQRDRNITLLNHLASQEETS